MSCKPLLGLTASLFLLSTGVGHAASPTEPMLRLETDELPPPAEWKHLAEPIRRKLSSQVLRIRRGEQVILEFWPVAEVTGQPGKPDGFVQLPSLSIGTLWGVAHWPVAGKDVRSNPIRPGTYTLRYGRQPADGDHLGLTDYRDFLLVLPAATDREPSPPAMATEEALIAASRKTTGKDHPAVLMVLRPMPEPGVDHTPRLMTRQLANKSVTMLELGVKFRTELDAEPTVLVMAVSVFGVAYP